MSGWKRQIAVRFIPDRCRGAQYIKITHGNTKLYVVKGEVGVDGANGNSPCGEMRRMFTREFSGYHGYRRYMFVMSWDSSCGQFKLTTSQHVLAEPLAPSCGQSMGQGFSLLYAVSRTRVVSLCKFRKWLDRNVNFIWLVLWEFQCLKISYIGT